MSDDLSPQIGGQGKTSNTPGIGSKRRKQQTRPGLYQDIGGYQEAKNDGDPVALWVAENGTATLMQSDPTHRPMLRVVSEKPSDPIGI